MKFRILAVFIVILSSSLFALFGEKKEAKVEKEEIVVKEEAPIEIIEEKYGPEHHVSGTFYNPVVWQCDSNPLVTADCSRIDLNDFPSNWIAVSRDLLREHGFKYGDKVLIEHSDPNICGIYEIHDTMNARFTKRIDFLVPPGETLGNGRWNNIKLRKILGEES